MRYPSQDQIAWQFDTANLRVIFHTIPEDEAPDFDDDGQTSEDIEAGRIEWFVAFVSVWFGTDENDLTYLAHDSLGGCAYRSVQEFITGHRSPDPENRNTLAMKARNTAICHYFPEMVQTACQGARAKLARIGNLKVREA